MRRWSLAVVASVVGSACGPVEAVLEPGSVDPLEWQVAAVAAPTGPVISGHAVLVNARNWESHPAVLAELESLYDRRAFREKVELVQVPFLWSDFERDDGSRDFRELTDLLAVLERRNPEASVPKKLVLQLNLHTFNSFVNPAPRGASSNVPTAANEGHRNVRIWHAPTRRALVAFIEALAAHVRGLPAARRGLLYALNFPETACSNCDLDGAYTGDGYIDASKALLVAARRALPQLQMFQYLNFVDPPLARGTSRSLMCELAATAHAQGVGLGGPDTAPTVPGCGTAREYHPPGYDVLRAWSGSVPINMSVQYNDYADASYDEVFALARRGPGGLNATVINWMNNEGPPGCPSLGISEAFGRMGLVDFNAGRFSAPPPTCP